MVTIQSQNFGVEIEMTGVSRGTAASVIANYFGVGGIHFAGGTYQTYEAKDSKGRVWKCMRDGSITPRRRRGGAIVEADDTYRCEVVTPILQYEDITDLQEVIRALVKKGAMANSSCGIHVHVDGANHTPESLCRLLNFATGRQDLFYEALQIGSRADHWCHKINPALFREMKKNGRASRNDAERIWYSVVNSLRPGRRLPAQDQHKLCQRVALGGQILVGILPDEVQPRGQQRMSNKVCSHYCASSAGLYWAAAVSKVRPRAAILAFHWAFSS